MLEPTPQIPGNICQVCGQDIVFAAEGKSCPHCRTAVHLACQPRDTCNLCGQAYRLQDRPHVDPLREAIVPPALRPARSGAPALAIFIMAALALGILIIWLALTHMNAK